MEKFCWKKPDLIYGMVRNNLLRIYRNGKICKCESLLKALNLQDTAAPVICAAGAGGKTSTLHRIADEYVSSGKKVCALTSTHILMEQEPYFLSSPTLEQIRETLEIYGQVWVGERAGGGKLKALSPDMTDAVMKWGIPVIIEADGARKLPVKVPDIHEPVIDERATHVLSVYGLDAVGGRISEICFRPDRAAALLKKEKTEIITPKDIAFLAGSVLAGKKGCPKKAFYTVILNKADNISRMEYAEEICEILQKNGINRILVTSYAKNRRG